MMIHRLMCNCDNNWFGFLLFLLIGILNQLFSHLFELYSLDMIIVIIKSIWFGLSIIINRPKIYNAPKIITML